MEFFDKYQIINDLIVSDNKDKARDELIKVLSLHKENDIPYNPLLNHLIRQLGLYPYLDVKTADWQENFIYEVFKVPIGNESIETLHIEQSRILKKLLNGDDIAISAPTSFGKSFIIDAFISIKAPRNIVIIVPTIALTDETRRRLQKKFSNQYKIITTTDVMPSNKNIFIFPQERALKCIEKLESLDILIIDEFYKADARFDQERSLSLLNVIKKLTIKAKQRYFLAPNISSITDNSFTSGMEFIKTDFNTVFLNIHEPYKSISTDTGEEKNAALSQILKNTSDKSLIYAGTFKEIQRISKFIADESISKTLNIFSNWLSHNYSKEWNLVRLAKNGTGIHNGRMHRSLNQIQIKLFSESDGLKNIISTSSVIEGVNTSAKNVILWKNKNGKSNLKYFSYKNLIGRSGRMFKYFIGEVYLLDKPPSEEEVQLTMEMPNELIDENNMQSEISEEKKTEIKSFYQEVNSYLQSDSVKKLKEEGFFENNNWKLIRALLEDMKTNNSEWSGLSHLNSGDPEDWERFLYRILKIAKFTGNRHGQCVDFIKTISQSWNKKLSSLLDELSDEDIDIDTFFELEKNVTFKMAKIFNCVNILQKEMPLLPNADISPFITKMTHAFLPKNVYLLEEYGLPRMLSKKIQQAQIIDMEDDDESLDSIIDKFNETTYENVINSTDSLDDFDKYILKYFFEGISYG